MDVPLPGWPFAGWKLVVVTAGKGLQRDEGGVVLEQDRDARSGIDLRLAGAPHDALPAEAGR